jgi:hypothetical protein
MPETPDVEQMQDELDDLKEGIDEARRDAIEHGNLDDPTPDQTFVDPDADGKPDGPGATIAT